MRYFTMSFIFIVAVATPLRGDGPPTTQPDTPQLVDTDSVKGTDAEKAATIFRGSIAQADDDFQMKVKALQQQYMRKATAATKTFLITLRSEQATETKKGNLETALAIKKLADSLEVSGLPGAPAVEGAHRAATTGDVKPAFLSDLQESDAIVGYGSFCKNGNALDGGKIVVDRVYYSHGLFLHPPMNGMSHVTYNLTEKYSIFETAVGINDGAIPATALVFRVLGNGKELWHSHPTMKNGKPELCRIDVTGVTTLELQVECDGSAYAAWAVWLDPVLK